MNKGKKTVELEKVKVGRELPGLAILYILTCCLWGGYHEYVSCVVSAALAVWLLLGIIVLATGEKRGWLPAAVLVIAIAKTSLGRATPFRDRLMLLVLCAHGLFDFSFQFVSIAMTMLLLLDYGEVRCVAVKKRRWVLPTVAGTVICVSLHLGRRPLPPSWVKRRWPQPFILATCIIL